MGARQDNRDLHRIVPSQVSNRRLLEQMKLWGWETDKTNGDMVTLTRGKFKIQLRRETVSQGNSSHMIRHAYDVTCNGDAITFWSRTTPIAPPRTPASEPVKPVLKAVPKLPEPEATQPEPDKEVPVVAQEPEKKKITRTYGVGQRVLEVVNRNPEIWTPSTMAGVLTDLTVDQCGKALHNLATSAKIRRISLGVYAQLEPSRPAMPDRDHQPAIMSQLDTPEQREALLDKAYGVWSPEEIAAHDAALAARKQLDKQVKLAVAKQIDFDEVLELILPADYKFKPSHLDAMSEWKQATQRLLDILNGGAK